VATLVCCKNTYVLNGKDYVYVPEDVSSSTQSRENGAELTAVLDTATILLLNARILLELLLRNPKQSAVNSYSFNSSPTWLLNETNLPKFHIPNHPSINVAKRPAMRKVVPLLGIPPCLSVTVNPTPFRILRPSQSPIVSATEREPVCPRSLCDECSQYNTGHLEGT